MERLSTCGGCGSSASLSDATPCPECGWRGYLAWPSYGNCQTCLRLRLEYLEERFLDAELEAIMAMSDEEILADAALDAEDLDTFRKRIQEGLARALEEAARRRGTLQRSDGTH
jgi:hypothetical protein